MINVNQITSQLAKMPDQALQQYASMHKNDPYTVALALAESNRRKEMRTGAQMQQGPQPKVVDQEIAGIAAPQQQMLPEDSGIAQLPADNIKGMAGGGIVAFEEGGHVPRFQNQGLVTQPTRLSGESFQDFRRRVFEAELQTQRDRNNAAVTTREAERQRLLAQRPDGFIPPSPFFDRKPLPASSAMQSAGITNTAPAPFEVPSSTVKGFSDTTDLDKMIESAVAKPDAKPEAKLNARPGTEGAGGGQKQPAPGLPSVNAAANALTGIDSLLPAKEKAQERDAFMAEREGISKPVWAKAEGMINKEKDRLNEGREQDFYMALIEGGLAAAGATGPNALQNIAQGFSKGTSSYASGLKDFRKAAQENSKMELDIERARAAEKRGDMDAYQKYEDSIKNRNADIDKLKTSGLFQLANTNLSGQYQLQASANTAAAQLKAASMPGAQERLFATLGGGTDQAAVVKGLKLFQEAQADKTGAAYAKLYSDYAANADKSGADKMSPVEFAQNMQQFMGAMQGGGFQQQPAGSNIRTLPPVK
jgi:hypothetical protein